MPFYCWTLLYSKTSVYWHAGACERTGQYKIFKGLSNSSFNTAGYGWTLFLRWHDRCKQRNGRDELTWLVGCSRNFKLTNEHLSTAVLALSITMFHLPTQANYCSQYQTPSVYTWKSLRAIIACSGSQVFTSVIGKPAMVTTVKWNNVNECLKHSDSDHFFYKCK